MTNKSTQIKYELQPNDEILYGRYRVEKFIGRGNFGQVYKIKKQGEALYRAVKVINHSDKKLTAEGFDELKKRLEQEVSMAEKITHTNVVKAYEFYDNGTQFFLIMDYIEGESLARKLEAGRLEVIKAIEITIELTKGLEALHKISVIHRDVKPSNILIGQDGEARIADLGIAQKPDGVSYRVTDGTNSPKHPGTPEYMSPEQEREVGLLTPSSDVYSLGCVLFEMLTGRLWKTSRSSIGLSQITTITPNIPLNLINILRRMLKETPGTLIDEHQDDTNRRYVTMAAVRKDLETLRHTLITPPQIISNEILPVEVPPTYAEKLKEYQKLLLPLAIMFLIASAFGGGMVLQPMFPTSTATITLTATVNTTEPITTVTSQPVIVTIAPTTPTVITTLALATNSPEPTTETATITPTRIVTPTDTSIPATASPTVTPPTTGQDINPPITPTITPTITPSPTLIAPTPIPLLAAVKIDDCDGKVEDMNCSSTPDQDTPNPNDYLLRWRWTPPADLPDGWYYTVSFLPAGNDNNAVFHTEKVSPNQLKTNSNWLAYSFDINDLPNDSRSCYPFWDVVVHIDAALVNCPTERNRNGICRLTEFPDRQRSLGTARAGTCASGGGGGGSREGSSNTGGGGDGNPRN